MSSKNQSGSNTVQLNTIVPELVVNPLDVAVPKTKISTPAISVPQGEMLKKAEFIDRAVERGDVKKRDAKPAIEAALAVLSEALMAGEELNLPPMGKMRVVKSKDIGDGARVLTLKLRTMKDGAGLGASKSDDDNNDD